MKKRIYRKRAVQGLDVAELTRELRSGQLVVAIDVAKVDMVAALTDGVPGPPRVLATVAWKNPTDNGQLLALLEIARAAGVDVQAVMESSGSTARSAHSRRPKAAWKLSARRGRRGP
jgi:hypothetical protein